MARRLRMSLQHPASRISRQGGFTLLEALISLVILSVGMLGIAALYVEGLRAGRTAVYRTAAVTLAADMMDRIRANPAARANYEGAGAISGCTGDGINCTPAQLAAEDIALWQADVAARMPGGTAPQVEFGPGALFDTYTITIQWPEAGFDEPLDYTLQARL